MDASLSCVLIDVGGTLWPGQWAATEAVDQARVAGLYTALPEQDSSPGMLRHDIGGLPHF